ncbi:MAG TPA: ATP cone domain-containing protein, partial [Limnobacter sp.]|nr:ATP cone domain-containing protein [Limnobacter sp.]
MPSQQDARVAGADSAYASYKIIRRNGAVVGFEPGKIAVAMTKAFLAVNGGQGAASARIRELVEQLTASVVNALVRRQPSGGIFHIEDIQDQVELALMRSGEAEVARAYVLYRERRAQERAAKQVEQATQNQLNVVDGDMVKPLDVPALQALIESAAVGLENIDTEHLLKETLKNLYDGVKVDEVYKSAILAARAMIENDPSYTLVTSRLLLHTIRKEIVGREIAQDEMAQVYPEYFPQFIKKGVEAGLLDNRLLQFDMRKLGEALNYKRDLQFDYLGLQTLYDRYFLHVNDVRIEMPQAFYMRVAMGLALNEIDRETRAIEFYNVLSTFDFMSSTPTLF